MSNETQWTPGPWMIYQDRGHFEITTVEQEPPRYRHMTNDMPMFLGPQHPRVRVNGVVVSAECYANARLMAAAPEMAALLERMTNAAERRLRELRALNSIDALQLTNDIADARALLAKIKGE